MLSSSVALRPRSDRSQRGGLRGGGRGESEPEGRYLVPVDLPARNPNVLSLYSQG